MIKLQLTVDDEAYQMLLGLQEASGAKSLAVVIRQAVTLYEWSRVVSLSGHTVCSSKDGIPVSEVVLPWDE